LRHVDSPKNWTNSFVCFFAVKSKKAKKTNSFLRFLGEPTARQSAYGFISPFTWFEMCTLRIFVIKYVWLNDLPKKSVSICEMFYFSYWTKGSFIIILNHLSYMDKYFHGNFIKKSGWWIVAKLFWLTWKHYKIAKSIHNGHLNSIYHRKQEISIK
jgi:hypothetical protein